MGLTDRRKTAKNLGSIFYRNKRLCKTTQYGGFETDPRYPTCRVARFRKAVAVVRS